MKAIQMKIMLNLIDNIENCFSKEKKRFFHISHSQ